MEKIVLGGGCFWCVEAVFEELSGIVSLLPGYAGGVSPNPTYSEVCGGLTGHAEVVEVEFDPDQVSLEDVLDMFFSSHDPTSKNRQGADVGSQYRSIILYTSEDQKAAVEKFIMEISGEYKKPIVTEVKALGVFYPAEEYHRGYYRKNPGQGYCQIVITPKVSKIKRKLVSER
jgi:methionine-S-sulfoxide reductase